ncbi:MAG: phage tail sheath subtilisin-like domain-containing protein [Treponema sp.]|uniref:phage tail sheath subtilisin-like domain-containing protein n=1 Tax=Treponema sp. TaxID=166 RepID=UPI003FA2E503
MGVSPAKFSSAGQSSEHYIPGNYSRRDVTGGGTGVSTGRLCIIGTSMGGKPLTLHSVSDKAEAQQLLVSGSLLDGVLHALNGSNTFVPQQVFCMRVNAGTQAALTLKKGSESILNVKSADYGIHTNQLKLWLKDGTTGKKVLVNFKGNETVIDNIAKKSFSVLYTGTGTSATCTINATGLTLTSDIAADSLTITWEECETIEEVVSRINDTGVYSAVLLDTTPNTAARELDHVTGISVKTTAATFNSDLQALIAALESVPYIGSVSLAGNSRLVPENNTGYVYFSGATAGTSTISDWSNAIDELEKYDIQIIATATTDSDIHNLITDHCVSMSTVSKKKERTCWFGTAKNTSLDAALAIARGFNSELVSLVMTGANANNPLTGAAEDISPALLACKCAGIESALGVSNPLTNKAIKVNSFDKKYTDGELNKMIAGGITPFGENDEGELVCIRAMTTYQGDSLILNERCMIRSVLYMDRDLRKAFNPRTGTNDEPSESSIIATLNDKARSWYAEQLLTKSDSGELVQNAKVRFDGDKTYLTFDRFVRAPNNFVFITATNKVYRSTVEV